MDELMDLMVNQDSPSQVSDKIKEILFARAEKLEGVRPEVVHLFSRMTNLVLSMSLMAEYEAEGEE